MTSEELYLEFLIIQLQVLNSPIHVLMESVYSLSAKKFDTLIVLRNGQLRTVDEEGLSTPSVGEENKKEPSVEEDITPVIKG
jgi:hypothetical protein